MKLPRLTIIKLEDGQKSRFAFMVRSILTLNVIFCSYYLYKSRPTNRDKIATLNEQNQIEDEERKALS